MHTKLMGKGVGHVHVSVNDIDHIIEDMCQ